MRIRAETAKWVKAIHEQTGRDEHDIKAALRAEMREHPNIGEISTDPPGGGAGDWMQTYGQFRVTKFGVFVPGGLFGWARIIKTPLVPFGHSAMYSTDVNLIVHLHVLSPEGKFAREIEIARGIISVRSPTSAVKAIFSGGPPSTTAAS